MDLGGFVNTEPGNETPGAHQNYRCVSDFLCAIVFGLGRKVFGQVQVPERHLDRFYQALSIRNHKAPFTGQDGEKHVEDSIDGKDPHKEEVVSQTLRYMVGSIHCLPEPVGEKTDERERPHPNPINRMGVFVGVVRIVPIDEQAAPDHGEEHGEIDPMHPADGERMFPIQPNARRNRRLRCFSGATGMGSSAATSTGLLSTGLSVDFTVSAALGFDDGTASGFSACAAGWSGEALGLP